MRVLGRLYSRDSRDHLFALSAPTPPTQLTERFWFTSAAYDQGQVPQCVAYAGVKMLDSGPVRNLKSKLPFSFNDLYNECQQVDEWAGTPHDGTSVRALFKILQKKGYITQYQWAFDVQTIINYVLTTGPMVVGTYWADSMWNTDSKGFIRLGGRVVGGHSYMIKGVNTLSKCSDESIGAFRIINSWGSSWGVNGCASISFKDFKNLLAADGEAATATEILKVNS